MSSSVTINSAQVKTLLLQLQNSLSFSSIRSELDVAGKVGEQEAKRLVPVDTGALKGSIYSEVKGNDTLVLGAGEEYAPYVEYGTSRQNAQPFIEPAAQRTLLTLEQNLQKKINKL